MPRSRWVFIILGWACWCALCVLAEEPSFAPPEASLPASILTIGVRAESVSDGNPASAYAFGSDELNPKFKSCHSTSLPETEQAWIVAAQELRFGELEKSFAEAAQGKLSETQVAAIVFAAQQAYSVEKQELAESWLNLVEPHASGKLKPIIAEGLVWCNVNPADLKTPSIALTQKAEQYHQSAFAPLALWQRGLALEKAGRHEEAIFIYHTLARNFPQSNSAARAMLHVVRLHDTAAQYAEAKAWAERLWKEHATAAEVAGVRLIMAERARKQGEIQQACDHWQAVVAQFPQHVLWNDAAYRLAEAWYKEQSHASESQALLEQIMSREETTREWKQRASYLQSQIAIQEQDWLAAASALEKCQALQPEKPLACFVAYWQGEVEYQRHHWDVATEKFERAAELAEGNSEPFWGAIPYRLALLSARRQEWYASLDHLERLQRTFADYGQPTAVEFLRGRCLFGLARLQEARDVWTKVIADSQQSPTQWTAQSQWMIGESYLLQQKYPEALAAYDAALEYRSFPEWQAAALVQSAKCCDALHRSTEATARYERVVREFSQTPYYAIAQRHFGDETPRVATPADKSTLQR